MILRIEKMKRIFFVFNKKIFSINFPFNIEKAIEREENLTIYDSITSLELNAKNHAILVTAFEEILNDKENKGMLDLDSDLMKIMDSFEMKQNKDYIWEIMKSLLIFEPGYLRYDFDEEHEDGRLHPLTHLDINYSSDSTYKIGLNNEIDSEIFIDILNINTDSYFISK